VRWLARRNLTCGGAATSPGIYATGSLGNSLRTHEKANANLSTARIASLQLMWREIIDLNCFGRPDRPTAAPVYPR
jgi:hypothetical protein